MKEKIKIYVATDGSAINNGDDTFTCAAGCVIDVQGDITTKVLELPNSTVNIAEINGMLMALDILEVMGNDKNYEIFFVLDSEYTLKSITKWYQSWNKNRKDGVPMTSSGTPAKNFEIIELAYNKLRGMKHKKVWKIRSHIPQKDIEKRYHEFCFVNKASISIEEFLHMRMINELCDKLVQDTTRKMLTERGLTNVKTTHF